MGRAPYHHSHARGRCLDGPAGVDEHQGLPAPFANPDPEGGGSFPLAFPFPAMRSIALVSLVLAFLVPVSLPGQEGVPQVPPSEDHELRVYLLTMDQGDEVWELFGHNALLIQNLTTGEELAWNWGLFNFEDVDFLPRFLRGTMRYTMGPAPLGPFLDSYARADRTVYASEVLLTPAEARELDAFVRWNYLPENRPYIYDYFRDNCSTRVRDALDGVLDGVIGEHFRGRMTPYSYRWHTRRLVQVQGLVDQGLSFLLGTRGDLPRSEWEAMFLPMELLESLEGFEFPDASGRSRSLLGPREVLASSARPPTPDGPPAFSLLWLGLGLGGGLLIAGMGWSRFDTRSRTSRPAAWGLAGLGAAWGLFAGLLGTLLVASWGTDHVFIQRNINLLYTSPLGLLLVPLMPLGLLRHEGWRARARTIARITALLIAAGSVLGAILQLLGIVTQGNAEVVAVALPVNVALAWALFRRASPQEP